MPIVGQTLPRGQAIPAVVVPGQYEPAGQGTTKFAERSGQYDLQSIHICSKHKKRQKQTLVNTVCSNNKMDSSTTNEPWWTIETNVAVGIVLTVSTIEKKKT
jgi:hypothetical protein